MAEVMGSRLYRCCQCRNHVARPAMSFPKAFRNVMVGPKEDRQFLSSLHTVADVSCSNCNGLLGWKYERAYGETQKDKEGKFTLKKSKIVKENW